MERTLVLIKPDAIHRDLVGRILSRIEEKGLQIVGLRMFTFSDALLRDHYRHLTSYDFFADLSSYMTSGPSVAVCVEGVDAISTVRLLTGVTKSRTADPGTIRGDYAMSIQKNLIHSSDSEESAKAEIDRFFSQDDLFYYSDAMSTLLYTADETA